MGVKTPLGVFEFTADRAVDEPIIAEANMSHSFTLTRTVNRPFGDTVAATRAALADQGFGIITEIDLSATLKDKLDVETPPQVILGACRPELAHRAILADASIATMLPCNVVVRQVEERACIVEAFDPDEMARVSDSEGLKEIASDVRNRLIAALDGLGSDMQEN